MSKTFLISAACPGCVQDKGVPLASNQIQYSLLYRSPEQNGMLQACRELGVTPIAYSPLCQGLLTGALSNRGCCCYWDGTCLHITSTSMPQPAH